MLSKVSSSCIPYIYLPVPLLRRSSRKGKGEKSAGLNNNVRRPRKKRGRPKGSTKKSPFRKLPVPDGQEDFNWSVSSDACLLVQDDSDSEVSLTIPERFKRYIPTPQRASNLKYFIRR